MKNLIRPPLESRIYHEAGTRASPTMVLSMKLSRLFVLPAENQHVYVFLVIVMGIQLHHEKFLVQPGDDAKDRTSLQSREPD